MERTLILVKPDGVQRGLVGEVVRRFERRGLKLVGMKLIQMSRELAQQHYDVHKERPFFKELVTYITSGPVLAMVWEGEHAIDVARIMIGSTNPMDAAPGSIRGDFCIHIGRNLVHGSDTPENGLKETNLFFKPEELVSWNRATESWIYE